MKLFVNIAVENVDRSVDFFTKLGFRFDERIRDETTACMVVNEDAYFMLAAKDRWREFTERELADSTTHAEALFAIACDSRDAVDELVRAAAANGGAQAHEPEDLGFMYSAGFSDPDGHQWGPFWLDPDHAG